MITIYGRASSSNVQLVMWALAEIGLDYERLDYGHSFGGNDTPEYLAMNPNGLIPVMRDGDLILWESAAIMRYLCARYAKAPFWPDDHAARAKADMWAEWCKNTFAPGFNLGLFWPLVRTPPSQHDQGAIKAAEAKVKKLAAILDAQIGAGPWITGDEFTFADLAAGHHLYRYYTTGFERAETPDLDAYYERLKARPAFAEHVMISYDALRVTD